MCAGESVALALVSIWLVFIFYFLAVLGGGACLFIFIRVFF